MRTSCRLFFLSATAGLLVVAAPGQDTQSLGDVARQARQQKQTKSAQAKDAKPSKVITNEELPEHSAPEPAAATGEENSESSTAPASANAGKVPPEAWKAHIFRQKNAIASMQKQIDELQESIRFAPANCVSGCVQWNERQREKQQQVERMQAQLGEMKKQLDDMQETARKQGYGSSVYDP